MLASNLPKKLNFADVHSTACEVFGFPEPYPEAYRNFLKEKKGKSWNVLCDFNCTIFPDVYHTSFEERNYTSLRSLSLLSLFQGIQEELKIAESAFLPPALIEHLCTGRDQEKALGKCQPWLDQTRSITPMEAVFSTFLVPIHPTYLAGDHFFDLDSYQHRTKHLKNKIRPAIISHSIQLDLESSGVIGEKYRDSHSWGAVFLQVSEITEQAVEGKQLDEPFAVLDHQSKIGKKDKATGAWKFDEAFWKYENNLKRHAIHHLTQNKRLPSLSETEVKEVDKDFITDRIKGVGPVEPGDLVNKYLNVGGKNLSLEVVFNAYVHQLTNEFTVLSNSCPQGFVWTFDPAVIFATAIGGRQGAEKLTKIHILALKYLYQNKPKLFENMALMGYNGFLNKSSSYGDVALLKSVFSDSKNTTVCDKSELFNKNQYYHEHSVALHKQWDKSKLALVIHNNSDAFAWNIIKEGPGGSLDGMVGYLSMAAKTITQFLRAMAQSTNYLNTILVRIPSPFLVQPHSQIQNLSVPSVPSVSDDTQPPMGAAGNRWKFWCASVLIGFVLASFAYALSALKIVSLAAVLPLGVSVLALAGIDAAIVFGICLILALIVSVAFRKLSPSCVSVSNTAIRSKIIRSHEVISQKTDENLSEKNTTMHSKPVSSINI